MNVGDAYNIASISLGVILIACAVALAVWKTNYLIRKGKHVTEGELDLTKMTARGPFEVILTLVGTALIFFTLKSPQDVAIVGLPVSLCAPAHLTTQRADGGLTNTTLVFIKALNSISAKDHIDQSVAEALTNSVAQDGNLRKSLRDATLRAFVASDDIDLWCRVDSHKLDQQSLSPEQKRMFNRVQELLEATIP